MQSNILIVEDDEKSYEMLKGIISNISREIKIYYARTYDEANYLMLQNNIHLFLIDIVLDRNVGGDLSGLYFADNTRKYEEYRYTPMIFITSLEDPKLYTLSKLHCFDYIEKPFSTSRVRSAVFAALDMPRKTDETRNIYLKKDGIIFSKQLKDIVYIESSRRLVKIYCVDDILEIPYKTMREIIHELKSDLFVQCSRYIILNRLYIQQIDYLNRFVKMKYYDNMLEIGAIMLKTFKERMCNE